MAIAQSFSKFDVDVPIRPFSEIEHEEMRWLWLNRIPLGGITVLAGDPGLGKSLVTTYITARVSRGDQWPERNAGRAPEGSVILVQAEDSPSQVIRQRLTAAGADLSKVYILDDIDRLAEAVRTTTDVRLVIIDPISAYFIGANIRPDLQSLKQMAEKRGLAVILISHLNKTTSQKALFRISGSVGITGISRATWIMVRDPRAPHRRLILPTKYNLGPGGTGLAFAIVDGVVDWDPEPFPVSDADLLIAEGPPRPTKLERAEQWLSQKLKPRMSTVFDDDDMRVVYGPASAAVATLMRDAPKEGLGWRTVEQAKRRLGINAVRTGGVAGDGEWWWFLPDPLSPQDDDEDPAGLDDVADLATPPAEAAASTPEGTNPPVGSSAKKGRPRRPRQMTVEEVMAKMKAINAASKRPPNNDLDTHGPGVQQT